jgi:hypothetical protein
LNKVAANISLVRDGAGVRWRTDYTESENLGEQIAIQILQDQLLIYLKINSFDDITVKMINSY